MRIRAVIQSREDLTTLIADLRPDVVSAGLCEPLVEALQAADHPPYGRDWRPWLDEHLDPLVLDVSVEHPVDAARRTHTTPTLDRVDCHHCGEPVADRPLPPPDDNVAWSDEALAHRLGCAAILGRGGSRPCPLAPTWARGTEYRNGDPAWFTRPGRTY